MSVKCHTFSHFREVESGEDTSRTDQSACPQQQHPPRWKKQNTSNDEALRLSFREKGRITENLPKLFLKNRQPGEHKTGEMSRRQ